MASPYTAYFAGMGTVVAALALGFATAVMMTSPLPSEKEQPNGLQKRAETTNQRAAQEILADPLRPITAPAPASPLITATQTPPSQTPPPWPADPSTTGQAVDPQPAPPSPRVVGSAPAPQPTAPAQAAAPAPAQPVASSSPQPAQAAAPPPAQATASAPAPVQAETPPRVAPEKVIPPSSIPTASAPPVQQTTPPVQQTTRSRETVRSPQREAVRNPDVTGSIDPVPGEWKKKEKRDGYAQKRQRRPVEQARPVQDDDEADVVIIERRSTTGYSSEPRSPLGIFDILTGGNR